MERTFRLRVGTFRILFQVDYETRALFILEIDNRGDIYYFIYKQICPQKNKGPERTRNPFPTNFTRYCLPSRT